MDRQYKFYNAVSGDQIPYERIDIFRRATSIKKNINFLVIVFPFETMCGTSVSYKIKIAENKT